jgi:hypothetical protein
MSEEEKVNGGAAAYYYDEGSEVNKNDKVEEVEEIEDGVVENNGDEEHAVRK